jgi:hypothetical protein
MKTRKKKEVTQEILQPGLEFSLIVVKDKVSSSPSGIPVGIFRSFSLQYNILTRSPKERRGSGCKKKCSTWSSKETREESSRNRFQEKRLTGIEN